MNYKAMLFAFVLLASVCFAGSVTTSDIKITTDKDFYSCNLGKCELMNLEVKKMRAIAEPLDIVIEQSSGDGSITNVQSFVRKSGVFKKKNLNFTDKLTYDVTWNAVGNGKFDVVVVGSTSGVEYARLDPWFNNSFPYCKNVTIQDAYAVANRLIWNTITRSGLNLTGLTGKQADSDDVRIVTAYCGNGGSEIPRDIEANGSDWAAVYFLANTSVGLTNYSVYFGNSTVTAPSYATDLNYTNVSGVYNFSNSMIKAQLSVKDLDNLWSYNGSVWLAHWDTSNHFSWVPMNSNNALNISLVYHGAVVTKWNIDNSTGGTKMKRNYIIPAYNNYLIIDSNITTSGTDNRTMQFINTANWGVNGTYWARQATGRGTYLHAVETNGTDDGLWNTVTPNFIIPVEKLSGSRYVMDYYELNTTGTQTLAESDLFYKTYKATDVNVSLDGTETLDLTVPNVSNVAPASDYYAHVNESSAATTLLNFTYNASDNVDLLFCELWINGSLDSTDLSPTNDTDRTLLNVNVTANVNTSWWVRCNDTSANSANSTPTWFYVNTTNATAFVMPLVCPAVASAPADLSIYQTARSGACCLNSSLLREYWTVGGSTYTKDNFCQHTCVNNTLFNAKCSEAPAIQWGLLMVVLGGIVLVLLWLFWLFFG